MEPAALNAEIGVAAMRFNYREFNEAGRVLDTEHGGIPGLSLRIGQRHSALEWEGAAGLHYGRVDYTGQSNSGVPYNTRTDEGIGDFSLRLGRWFESSVPVMPYAGLGYRRWDRDILAGGLSGLFESYRWKYAWLGAKIVAYQQGASNLLLDIGWMKPITPEIRIDFKGAYNAAPTVYPESRDGLRLMLASRMALSGNATLILEPYVEYWELGRSPIVTLGGVAVYEPASKTRNIGINLRLGRAF